MTILDRFLELRCPEQGTKNHGKWFICTVDKYNNEWLFLNVHTGMLESNAGAVKANLQKFAFNSEIAAHFASHAFHDRFTRLYPYYDEWNVAVEEWLTTTSAASHTITHTPTAPKPIQSEEMKF